MSSSWTSRPVFAGVNAYLKFVLRDVIITPGFCCLFAAALTLTGCDEFSTSHVTTTSSVAPPGSTERPIEPGQLGRSLGPDGLPNLEPAKGVNVNVDSLFAKDIKDPIDRIKRLENAVLDLRRDYDATLPSIKRLVGIEKDMQTLMSQLEILTNGGPSAPMEAVPMAAVESVPVPSLSAQPLSATQTASVTPQNQVPVPLVPAVPDARTSVSPTEESMAIPKTAEVAANAPANASGPQPKTDIAKAQPPPQPPPTAPPPTKLATAPPPDIPKPPVTATEKSTPQQSQTVAAKPVSGSIVGSGVRLGEDGGKTRLVIDLSGSVTHRTDLDNDEKILVIEMNGAGWTAAATQAMKSPIVQSYTTQPLENAKGTRLIVTLKKPVTVTLDKELPPEATNKNYRLVIDLKGK